MLSLELLQTTFSSIQLGQSHGDVLVAPRVLGLHGGELVQNLLEDGIDPIDSSGEIIELGRKGINRLRHFGLDRLFAPRQDGVANEIEFGEKFLGKNLMEALDTNCHFLNGLCWIDRQN
jgi:hypothetical protein